MTEKIFISYASEDRDAVTPFVAELRRNGCDVWIDHQQIGKGDSIVHLIDEAISNSTLAIVFFSDAYVRKPWTSEERLALVYQFVESKRDGHPARRILVVKLDDTPLPPTMAHRLWHGSDPVSLANEILSSSPMPTEGFELTSPAISPAPKGRGQGVSISHILGELDGNRLEQVAIQIVEGCRDSPLNGPPHSLSVFLSPWGKLKMDCMPRPASDFTIQELEASLEQCGAHRRHIGSFQNKLADGGLGIFDESFRIAMDRQIVALDGVRFGTGARSGLADLLETIVLSASVLE